MRKEWTSSGSERACCAPTTTPAPRTRLAVRSFLSGGKASCPRYKMKAEAGTVLLIFKSNNNPGPCQRLSSSLQRLFCTAFALLLRQKKTMWAPGTVPTRLVGWTGSSAASAGHDPSEFYERGLEKGGFSKLNLRKVRRRAGGVGGRTLKA